MSPCLTEEQIRNLASDAIVGEPASSLLAHVETCPVCGQALAEWRRNLPFMALLRRTFCGEVPVLTDSSRTTVPPEPVEGYTIQQEIHRGAQGIVYRATDARTSAAVAIKFLGQGPYASPVSRRRFEREIDLVAGLHHPGIIRILNSGTTPSGRHYFVMNYVEGLPLHRYVWHKGLSLEDALALFIRVCDAVNYAHQRGVIHCDLKPSNILVDADGSPRILDFGLARCTYSDGNTRLSITGQIMGTLPYMSPEQTRADRSEIDIRTDVYALGVVLYEILTGRYPYPVAGTVPEVLRHIAETPPAPPSKLWTRDSGVSLKPGRPLRALRRSRRECPIDDQVDTILLKALAKEPHRRYANVAMFMEDLSRHLRGQPIEARREAWVHTLSKRLLRYKTGVLLACVCAVLTAALAVMNWQTNQIYKLEHGRTVSAHARLAVALMLLGDNALARDDLETASGNYHAAVYIVRDLAAGDMHNLDYLKYEVDAYVRMGTLMRMRGNTTEAVQHYAKALELARQLAAADPRNPDYHAKLTQTEYLNDSLRRGDDPSSRPASRPAGGSLRR